jgi:putative tryptophan/tyrosine transport system substrate-binding protein
MIPASIDLSTRPNPVDIGLVASLSRPGGNVTGVTDLQTTVVTKRLGLLHELVPTAKVIAILVNQTNKVLAEADAKEAAAAAAALGLRLLVLSASSPAEIEESFMTLMREGAGGLLTNGDSYFMTQRTLLAALTARHSMPTVFTFPENAEAGGLMSYGTNMIDTTRQIGVYAGRILKGEKPADLPVQQTAKLGLVLNLNTAKALHLAFPETLLAIADKVLE